MVCLIPACDPPGCAPFPQHSPSIYKAKTSQYSETERYSVVLPVFPSCRPLLCPGVSGSQGSPRCYWANKPTRFAVGRPGFEPDLWLSPYPQPVWPHVPPRRRPMFATLPIQMRRRFQGSAASLFLVNTGKNAISSRAFHACRFRRQMPWQI